MITKKIQLYAETIKPLLEWIKENPNDKDVKYTVTRLIRFYSNTPKELGIPYMYSRAALQKAQILEIPDAEERLKWVTWRQQTNKAGLRDVGRIDGVFHLEHIVPVSQIAKKLYALEDITVRKIYAILVNNFKIAWILKTEQKVLDEVNRSGERTPKEMTSLNIFIKGYNY